MRTLLEVTGGLLATCWLAIGLMLAVGHLTHGDELAFQSNASGARNIFVVDLERGMSRQLTHDSTANLKPVWSPDGSQIAYASNPDGVWDIFVMDATGRGQRRLTGDGSNNNLPSWAPDGQHIVYESDRGGAKNLYVVDVATGTITQLTFDGSNETQPAWSADGRIAFVSNRDGERDIYTMLPNSTNLHRMTYDQVNVGALAWGPDGELAFVSERDLDVDQCTGRIEVSSRCIIHVDIYSMGPDGVIRKLSSHSGSYWSPVWSPTGTKLAYASTQAGHEDIYLMNADGSGAHIIPTGLDPLANNNFPAWRP